MDLDNFLQFAIDFNIQYLKVFSKDMKHLYADNIQFGGGLNFGIKHTMSTLTIYKTGITCMCASKNCT